MKTPPCPLCASWKCLDCGHVRGQANRRHPNMDCPKCKGLNGEFRDLHHRDAWTYEEHLHLHSEMLYAESSPAVLLISSLTRYRGDFYRVMRETTEHPPHSQEHSKLISRAARILRDCETEVRRWVAQHPQESE